MEINNDFFSQLILDINNVRFNKKLFKGYNVQEVDQLLDDLINNLSNDMDFTYKLKKLEYLINEKKFSFSVSGYNIKEVDEFLDSLIKRTKV